MAKKKPAKDTDELQGWQEIAQFLGQPVAVAQRWGRTGMPMRRKGRYITASRAELNQWLTRESGGEPVQITTAEIDLTAELKRGLDFVRKQRRPA